MNRRGFLKLLGLGAVVAPVAPALTLEHVETTLPPKPPVTTVGYAQISDKPLPTMLTTESGTILSHTWGPLVWEGNTYQGAAPMRWRRGRNL